MENCLKCTGYSVGFQEVPEEISLIFNVSGCPHKCEGCHSSYLAEYTGIPLLECLREGLESYKNYITCVCFMGGEWKPSELLECNTTAKKLNLKTCLYSGSDDKDYLFDNFIYENGFDFIKIGHYEEKCGGLSESTTNQRFYKITELKSEDITHKFLENKKRKELS